MPMSRTYLISMNTFRLVNILTLNDAIRTQRQMTLAVFREIQWHDNLILLIHENNLPVRDQCHTLGEQQLWIYTVKNNGCSK